MVTSEAKPYSKTGGLADVTGALPEVLAKLGHTATLVVPRYREVRGIGRPKGLDEANVRTTRGRGGTS